MSLHHSDRSEIGYLPESLVIDGYRLCQKTSSNLAGGALQLFETVFDRADASLVVHAFIGFIQTLKTCSTCPMHHCPQGRDVFTLHELLLLGLIAGIQHDDGRLVTACLDRLTCQNRCSEVAYAAAIFAVTLRSLGQVLSPLTLASANAEFYEIDTRTLH